MNDIVGAGLGEDRLGSLCIAAPQGCTAGTHHQAKSRLDARTEEIHEQKAGVNHCSGLISTAVDEQRSSNRIPSADVFRAALIVSEDLASTQRWHKVLQEIAPRCSVAFALGPAEARDLMAVLPHDLVLVDIDWSFGESIQFIAHVRVRHPSTEIIAVASATDHAPMSTAIVAGATGCLLVDAADEELAYLLSSLKRWGAPVDSRIARRLLDAIAALAKRACATSITQAKPLIEAKTVSVQTRTPYPALSSTEMKVLRLIARGWTNRQIADAVCSSVHTVATHTRNIYRKLSAHSRTQAVHQATLHGLLGESFRGRAGSADVQGGWQPVPEVPIERTVQ